MEQYAIFNIAERKVELAQKEHNYTIVCQIPIPSNVYLRLGFIRRNLRYTLYPIRLTYAEWMDSDQCDLEISNDYEGTKFYVGIFTWPQLKDVVNVVQSASEALIDTGYDDNPSFLAYVDYSNNGSRSVVSINRNGVEIIYTVPVQHYFMLLCQQELKIIGE